MTKTTPAPRVRAINLYTVEQDGQPVAQAEAISQSEAVRLYVESQQRPALSARLATPRESRELAHLPLLSRGAEPAAGLPAEFLDYIEGEEDARCAPGEPMPSAPSTAAPAVRPLPMRGPNSRCRPCLTAALGTTPAGSLARTPRTFAAS